MHHDLGYLPNSWLRTIGLMVHSVFSSVMEVVKWRNSRRPLWLFRYPFSQRLWSEQTAVVWLPQDSQTSCSDLRRLFDRSALARREFRRTPPFTVSAGCRH